MAYTTIDKPSDYFNTVLYTGNGGTNNITGLDFQPDWVWIKSRNDSANHNLFDVVRGATKYLKSNATNAETTDSTSLTSFNSNGFTLGSNDDQDVNKNNDTYVSWSWKAGTSFTNDASGTGIGSIDSTGSASDTSGFSIISWSGTGSTGTLKHGLSTTPSMIITKSRGSSAWCVYNKHLGNTNVLFLDTVAATSAHIAYWNNTSPTSSVFTVGSDDAVNHSGNNMIAYCFAEKKGYSKFGSYTGNGNADGTFVYTGFKPAWVMGKKTDGAEDWFMFDNKRDAFNLTQKKLRANSNAAENDNSSKGIDFLAQGFKLRTSNGEFNGSGGNWIYMAFAENPFVSSTGVPATAR